MFKFYYLIQGSHIRIYNVDRGWKVQKNILAKSLRWTVTDTSLSPDQRHLVSFIAILTKKYVAFFLSFFLDMIMCVSYPHTPIVIVELFCCISLLAALHFLVPGQFYDVHSVVYSETSSIC